MYQICIIVCAYRYSCERVVEKRMLNTCSASKKTVVAKITVKNRDVLDIMIVHAYIYLYTNDLL